MYLGSCRETRTTYLPCPIWRKKIEFEWVSRISNTINLSHKVSVLIVRLSYGVRIVLSFTRCKMLSFLAFRDSPTSH